MGSQKKKRKKCKVCMSRKHEVEDCPCAIDECSEGDACRKWCMVDLCSKLQKFSRRMHKASVDGTQVTWDKLEDFEDDLERAYEWLTNHKGKRRTSCSSRKEVRKLQNACDRLRDAYVVEFEDESSDDDDRWVGLETDIHHVGIPKMEEKEVQKEVGQESLKLPLDTPTLPLECAHRVETEYPLLKLMSVLSLVNEIYYLEEKQIIHIKDVVHGNQRPFEEADNVRNGQVDSLMNEQVMDRERNEEEEHESAHEAQEDYSFMTDQSVMLIGNSHTFEEDSCRQQMEDVHVNADIMAKFFHFKWTSKQMSKEDVKIAKQQLQQQGPEDGSSRTEEIEDDDIHIGMDKASQILEDVECDSDSNLHFNSDSVSILDLDSIAIFNAKTNLDANFNGSRGKLDEERSELMMYDVPWIQHSQRSVDQVSDHGKVKKQIQDNFQELARVIDKGNGFSRIYVTFVEVAEDQDFHSEAFKDVILMTNVQFNFSDVLVVERSADLIGLWATLGHNGSDILWFKSIQLVVWQE
ncbi:hypothetical protein L7F22_028919 [Adiantum nelumboides]|nr:hypothetical protein [Adiantum nelumboides]